MIFLLILNSEADRAIVSDLFAKNYHRMKRTAMGILGESAAAEDVVQDTFVRCIKRVDSLRALPDRARSMYLLTATRHNAFNRKKRDGRIVQVSADELELQDETTSVEEQAIRTLTVAELKDAFKRLPDSLKDVLRYKYLLELSDGEIAEALGVTKSTVRSYLTRARRAVLKLCREDDHA